MESITSATWARLKSNYRQENWLKKIRSGFWNDPISKREDPKYKLTGKPRNYHVQENLNGQAQVRRARFQIYLTKIKTDFQSHKDSVFFIDINQEVNNDKIYIQSL